MTDSKIIRNFIRGKKRGFDALYEAYSPMLYAVCLRYTRCEDDAKEVLQLSFIKIFEKRETFDATKPFGPWAKTIVIRTALNFIREYGKFKLTENEAFFDDMSNVEVAQEDTGGLKERLHAALNQLPTGYRTVFSLYAIDNLTHKEIAGYLGISEGTSKSQYSKAKKMIQALLQNEKIAS